MVVLYVEGEMVWVNGTKISIELLNLLHNLLLIRISEYLNLRDLQYTGEEEVVLGEARHGEVPAELLDVVGGGPEEVDGLEVRHGLPGAGGVVHGLDEEDLLPQQIRLAVHHAHHPNGLGIEDEDLHARDVVEHAVDVVADESDQHHC